MSLRSRAKEWPMHNECQFSPDRKYRYFLQHRWDEPLTQRAVIFIGLNPSTADETKLDPTLCRVRGFAAAWGYNSFIMLNLFGYRTTSPKNLRQSRDPVGSDSDWWIAESAPKADLIVAAWGSLGSYRARAEMVLTLLSSRPIYCLGTTQGGYPKHPLYVPSGAGPVPYRLRTPPLPRSFRRDRGRLC